MRLTKDNIEFECKFINNWRGKLILPCECGSTIEKYGLHPFSERVKCSCGKAYDINYKKRSIIPVSSQ